ncbi:hypothetical protein FACS189499_02630 [Clostridia bacterium]|nr:hypothetical protein FACS189499_02630 [Clostridia bacterium]
MDYAAPNGNKPTNFYAGDEIKPETISNIKEYNNANMIMWGIFGGMITLLLSAGLFLNPLAYLEFAAAFVWMFIAHNKVAKKYTINNIDEA